MFKLYTFSAYFSRENYIWTKENLAPSSKMYIMKIMILIAGLGNPEKKYSHTPHNLGFNAIDAFKEKFNFPDFILEKNGLVSRKGNVILLKPQTYMNNSGKAVKEIKDFYKIEDENVWVVHDENELPLGEIKVSVNKGDGGHNGIKSIIEMLHSKDFVRFRIGINTCQKEDLMEYVLRPFSKENQEIADEAVFQIVSALDESIKNGVEKAMNTFNQKI